MKEIKNIQNLYKDYLKENNLPIDEKINENIESDYDKKNLQIIVILRANQMKVN